MKFLDPPRPLKFLLKVLGPQGPYVLPQTHPPQPAIGRALFGAVLLRVNLLLTKLIKSPDLPRFYNSKFAPSKTTPKSAHVNRGWELGGLPVRLQESRSHIA